MPEGHWVASELLEVDEPVTVARRARRAPSIAWAAWLAAIVPAVAGLVFQALTWGASIPDSYGFRGWGALFALTCATIGAIILARQPGHRIGWIFAAAGIVDGVLTLAIEYANFGLYFRPGSLPGAVLAAWLGSWIFVIPIFLVGPALFLVFPEGRLLTPRWRWVLLSGLVPNSLFGIGLAFASGPLENFRSVENPFGLAPLPAIDSLAGLIIQGLFILVAAAAAASLAMRYRRAGQTQRQQLKWVAFASLIVVVLLPFAQATGKPGEIAFQLALLGMPVAAGIAVLRYRLYDIDFLINRTIVYGLLTAILAGVYTALIGLLQRVFVTATGKPSDAAILLTTIIVVSVFTPIRARLQALVERRFKETLDPSRPFADYVNALEVRLGRIDADVALRRLLSVALAALDASNGSVSIGEEAGERPVATTGTPPFEVALSAFAGEGHTRVRLAVGSRTGGAPYRDQDRAAVGSAVAAVAEALAQQA
jgi:hypothetical protein